MRNLVLLFLLLSTTILSAQDSLAYYSFAELDTLYNQAQKPQDQLLYALTMLKKGEKELDIQDTTYANILFKVGNTYIGTRDLKNAKLYLQKAIDIQKIKVAKSSAHANSLNKLGIVYYYQGQLEKVEALWLQALKIRKEVLGQKHSDYANSLNNLGALYSAMGDYPKVETFYLQALKITKEVLGQNHPNYAKSLNNLGILYADMGDNTKAEAFYLQALNIKKEVLGPKHPDYATSLQNLGVLYKDMGDYAKAETFSLQALNIKKEVLGQNHPDYASSLQNLGALYWDMGDRTKAEIFYLQALNIRKEVLGINNPNYAAVLNNLGVLYKNMGDARKAETFYLQALGIKKQVLGQKHPDYAKSLLNLGNLYLDMGNYAKGDTFYRQALKIQKEVLGQKHPDYASTLLNLGALYKKMRAYDKGEQFSLQALNIQKEILGQKHPDYANSLNKLGRLYKEMNRMNQAWEYVLLSIESNSGLTVKTDFSFKLIDDLLYTNYVSFENINTSLILAYDLLGMESKTQIKDSQKEKQGLICDLALNLLDRYKNELADESDKLRILSQNSEWVLRAIEILDKDKNGSKALNLVEKNKSVLLLDAISNKEAYASGLLPDSLIQKDKNLQKQYANTQAALAENRPKSQLDSIGSILTDINVEMVEFQKQLKKDYPKYAGMRYQHSSIKANEIQSSLDDNTALLEYLIGDSVVYIFCVTKETVKIQEFVVDQETLSSRINEMHEILSNYTLILKNEDEGYEKYTENAYWFYEKLVAPVLGNSNGIKHLIIIPDGELGHLPFETFLAEKAPKQKIAYNELHYLINDFQISYNYSANLWKENKGATTRKNNGQILGMASNYEVLLDSTKRDWRLYADRELRELLSPLPAARKEVETLQENFQGFFVFDMMASESMFKENAANFGIIHLAMHGLLNSQEQVLSSLAFTEISDSTENNFLCAYEIAKMELNADLVVLSACETGYGKFERGNGIASLARSFMYAGVPAMVVTLWQVNDQATALIMENLYNNLADGMRKDEALRQAKLEYMKSAKGITAHPAFWSPSIMIGNTKPITISRKNSYLSWMLVGGGLILALGLLFLFFRLKK